MKYKRSVAKEKRFEARNEENDHNIHIITQHSTKQHNGSHLRSSELRPSKVLELGRSYSKQSANDTVTASPMKKE